MKDHKYSKIDEYLHEIKLLQVEALLEIKNQLRRTMHSVMADAKIKRGVLSDKNDYRNYVWLSIPFRGQEFWITTNFIDIDKKSGNIHNQLGRIQFWKNVAENTKGAVASPNRRAEDGKHFMFCPENSYDPSIYLYDDDYSPKKVQIEFYKFLSETLKESVIIEE